MKASKSNLERNASPLEQVKKLLAENKEDVKLDELNSLLQSVWERKQQLEQQDTACNLGLLLRFLEHSRCPP